MRCACCVARYARTHGPFTTEELRERYGVDASAVLRELERDGELVRGELRPGGAGASGATSRSCAACVAPRWRRCARRSSRPSSALWRPSCPPGRASTATRGAGAGIDRLREVLVPLQGLALPVEIWERDVLPRRTGAYSQSWLDMLCASGELVWVGAGPLGRSGRVALYFREDAPLIGPPPSAERRAAGAGTPPPGGAEHELLRARLAQSPCFFSDLLAELELPAEALREALWDLVWAGEATNDAWAPLRAPRLALARARARAAGRRAPLRLASHGRAVAGAGSLVADRRRSSGPVSAPTARERHRGAAGRRARASPRPDRERRRVLAELLLERYGMLTREQVLAEGVKGGFAMLYDTLEQPRDARRLPSRLLHRGHGRGAVRAPGGRRAVARRTAVGRPRGKPGIGARPDAPGRGRERPRTLVIAAADPAQPYGAALPWPKREGQERRPSRVAGAYVVLVADEPALYVERGGRGLLTLTDAARRSAGEAEAADVLGDALAALAEAVRAGRVRQAGAGANRRRAGDRIGARRAAAGARIPLGSAAADAERLSGAQSTPRADRLRSGCPAQTNACTARRIVRQHRLAARDKAGAIVQFRYKERRIVSK